MAILEDVNLAAFLDELASLLLQSNLDRLFLGNFLSGCKLPDILGYFHRTATYAKPTASQRIARRKH